MADVSNAPNSMLAELSRFGWTFFRFDGRLGREVYWLSTFFLVALVGMTLEVVPDPETGGFVPAFSPFGGLVVGISFFSSFAIAIKRLHDVNMPGWFAVVLVIPVLSVAFTLGLGLPRGTQGPNRFGPAADIMPEPYLPDGPPN
ncbi:MAG: DUF805 domain-containing protein [Hyphomicrobiaceae bacterium]|nr:DUF805 domain-containing protein [Hyphomicrobiaceae bacterium]